MKYAVIKVQGQQFRVSEGDEILVNHISDEEKVAPEILMVVDEDKVKIGTPILSGSKVELKLVGERKAEKIHVRKYRAKSRYRKHIGSRALHTVFSVGKIL